MSESEILSRRWFLSLLGGGTLALGIAGCGGGKSVFTSGTGAGNGGGGNGGGGLGGDPGALTAEAHFAAINAIGDFVNNLSIEDFRSQQQAVLGFLRSRNEIKVAGESDGGAWAVFKNGFGHVVVLNKPQSQVDDSEIPSSRAAGTGVPKDGPTLLMNAMGPGYPDEGARIRPALAAGGYNPQTVAPTLNALRDIGTPAFFFLSAHGIDAKIGGTDYFLLSTATAVDPAISTALYAEGTAGYVFTGTFTTSFDSTGRPISGSFYGISQLWIARYWKFAPSSLVWLSACSSQSAKGQLIVQACLGTGAGAVAGYTDDVLSRNSDRIQRYMIDRLVGANVLSPKAETPQRPFDYDKLLTSLSQEVGNSFPVIGSNGAALQGRFTSLKITKGADNLGLLAPSITYVLVDEARDQAILKGIFGIETEGKVFIGGVEAPVHLWGEEEIRCSLPRTGSGSAGDVEVVVRGHKSNVRRISRWTLDGTYHAQPSADDPFQVDGTVRLVFRADVGEYRQNPGKVFIRPTRYAIATRDSSAQLTAKGILLESCGSGRPNSSTTWTGEGNWDSYLPEGSGPPAMDRGIIAYLSLNTIDKIGTIALAFAIKSAEASPFRQIAIDCDGNNITVPLPPFPPSTEPVEMRFPTEESDVVFPVPGKTFSLAGDWNIPKDRMSSPDINTYFEWNAAGAEFPPDPEAARSR